MSSVADMVIAMYMRCIHAGLRSRFDEPNLLTWYFEVLYMVTQMPVSTTTGWAWESSCGVGCAIGVLVSFLPLVLFSLTLCPLTS